MFKVDEVAAVVVVFEDGKISLGVKDSIEGGMVEVVDGDSDKVLLEGVLEAAGEDISTSLSISL